MKTKRPKKYITRITNRHIFMHRDAVNHTTGMLNFLVFIVKSRLLLVFRLTLLLYVILSLSYGLYEHLHKVQLEVANHNILYNTKLLLNKNYDLQRLSDNAELIYKKRWDSIDYLYKSENPTAIIKDDNRYDFNWENICFWMTYFDIKHPEVVRAQILLETDFLTSDVCKINRNLFGMKQAIRRDNLAVITNLGHAYYNSYIESIYDYKLWQQYTYKNPREDYYKFLLRSHYAQDQHYVDKLKTMPTIDQYKKYFEN